MTVVQTIIVIGSIEHQLHVSTVTESFYKGFFFSFWDLIIKKCQTIYNWVDATDGSFLNLGPLMLLHSKSDLHERSRGLPSDAYCGVYIGRFKHLYKNILKMVYKIFSNKYEITYHCLNKFQFSKISENLPVSTLIEGKYNEQLLLNRCMIVY